MRWEKDEKTEGVLNIWVEEKVEHACKKINNQYLGVFPTFIICLTEGEA
jgi:hypothetical protein